MQINHKLMKPAAANVAQLLYPSASVFGLWFGFISLAHGANTAPAYDDNDERMLASCTSISSNVNYKASAIPEYSCALLGAISTIILLRRHRT